MMDKPSLPSYYIEICNRRFTDQFYLNVAHLWKTTNQDLSHERGPWSLSDEYVMLERRGIIADRLHVAFCNRQS